MADDQRRNKPASREVHIGTDTTGAEYWLVPYKEATVGSRKFEIRKSKKHVPVELQGMFTNGDLAVRAFDNWRAKQKQKAPTTKPETE